MHIRHNESTSGLTGIISSAPPPPPSRPHNTTLTSDTQDWVAQTSGE